MVEPLVVEDHVGLMYWGGLLEGFAEIGEIQEQGNVEEVVLKGLEMIRVWVASQGLRLLVVPHGRIQEKLHSIRVHEWMFLRKLMSLALNIVEVGFRKRW